jgi:hypothetical protein
VRLASPKSSPRPEAQPDGGSREELHQSKQKLPQWLRQLEQVAALMGGLAVEAQLRSEGDIDIEARRHARWLDEEGGSALLATRPAPELLGALLPHIVADGPAPTMMMAARSPVASPQTIVSPLLSAATATAAAIATPPRTSKRTLVATTRWVLM